LKEKIARIAAEFEWIAVDYEKTPKTAPPGSAEGKGQQS
jgi:hypothetical protein